jgi:NAD(P)-dependent dehydrogenase (short-subunit alcohol dehydrogenase family)
MTKILVVTGASRGIGAATAIGGAARGYAVAAVYNRDAASAEGVVARVAAEADVVRLFETVDARLGRVTALVNNAGMVPRRTRADALTAEDIAAVLLTNAGGTMLCCREALKRMLPAHGGAGGAIVNVSSMSAPMGAAHYWVHYGASKGAVDSYSIGLAREVAGEGVRVNVVRPGLIDTEMHARSGQPDRIEKYAARQPMKRAGTPEEVADNILWLLSDAASYVSGAFVNVAGGL